MMRLAGWMGALALLVATGTVQGQAPAAAANAPADPALVVWQGDARLTLDDIDGRLSRIPPDKRAGFMNDPERIEQMLRGLLLTKLLAREAEAKGISADPVVAAEIELAKNEILARRVMSLHMRDIKVPDLTALAHERYIASPEQYTSAEVIDVRNILVASKTHGEGEAKKRAEDLRRRILAGELDFIEAAREHNEDGSSKDNAGLIEGLTRGTTLADFEAAAFALKQPGDVSELVETKFGYHIIRLEKRIPAERYAYDQVKDKIVQELQAEYVGRARQQFLDKHRSAALDANPGLVQSLRTRYQPGGPGSVAIERTQGVLQVEAPSAAEAAQSQD